MTRFSIDNISKDLYKRVNADETNERYYECVNDSKTDGFYQSISYGDIESVCIAKFADELDEKLFLTTEIYMEDGIKHKRLRALAMNGTIWEDNPLPNGKITHKQLKEYVAKIYSEIKNKRSHFTKP